MLARDRAPAECSTITREIAVALTSRRGRARPRERLAIARFLESRDGEPVFGMDRETFRRAT